MSTKDIANKKFVFNKVRKKRTIIIIIKRIKGRLIELKLIVMNC
jgi:hypothetical protein